jgi:hypothetical protein
MAEDDKKSASGAPRTITSGPGKDHGSEILESSSVHCLLQYLIVKPSDWATMSPRFIARSESLHSSLGQFKDPEEWRHMKAMGARELSPPCSARSEDLQPMSNVRMSPSFVAGFCFRGKFGRASEWSAQRPGMNGFDLNSARFRLFQLRKATAGGNCMNNNASCAPMQCKATLFLRFKMMP